jgi:hypothetical protein
VLGQLSGLGLEPVLGLGLEQSFGCSALVQLSLAGLFFVLVCGLRVVRQSEIVEPFLADLNCDSDLGKENANQSLLPPERQLQPLQELLQEICSYSS